jgi:hypothetical protein
LRPSSSLTETLVLAPVAEAWAVSEVAVACKVVAAKALCKVEVWVEETGVAGTMGPAAMDPVAMDPVAEEVVIMDPGDLVEAPEVDLIPAVVMDPAEVMVQGGDAVALVLAEAVALAGEVAEASSRCSSSLIQYFR